MSSPFAVLHGRLADAAPSAGTRPSRDQKAKEHDQAWGAGLALTLLPETLVLRGLSPGPLNGLSAATP